MDRRPVQPWMSVPSKQPKPVPLREAITPTTAEARAELAPEPSALTPLVSVLVPAYNEAGTIEDVVHRVAAQPLRTEIIVVDDGSVDGTGEALGRLTELKVPGLQV